MTASARLLVVRPDTLAGPDRFRDWLAADGLELRELRPYAGDPVPTGFDEDALLVLGGGMSAWEDGRYPWLADVRALLRFGIAHERPTLGICLGAQLLAMACGGAVGKGDHGLEAGIVTLHGTAAAAGDALLGGLPSTFVAAAMHGDAVVGLPPDAVRVLGSDPYPVQAFRVGRQAWGVQFHPEVSPASFRRWVAAHEAAGAGREDIDRLRRGADELELGDEQVRTASRHIARRFARLP